MPGTFKRPVYAALTPATVSSPGSRIVQSKVAQLRLAGGDRLRGAPCVAHHQAGEQGESGDRNQDERQLQAIAGRIIAAVCAPYSISGHAINIGASIGIAVIDRRARDAGDILRYADMALYRAKNEGRNRACIYDAAMDADLSQRKLLESDLLHAIRNDGL